jgi:uncharacterized protein (UPF0212 family)
MWIIFAAVVVVLFGGLIYFASRDAVDVSNINDKAIVDGDEKSGGIAEHVLGKKDSKVVLIEYGDYQCPGCGSAHAPIKAVTKKYENKMAFAFRNFPLTTIHPNARASAAAAETAGLMGKYWEMHDKLYENQSEWQSASANDRTSIFANYADTIGLDTDTFTKNLTEKSSQINQKISFDQALGKKAGVSGTPTFYLNGKIVDQQVKDGKLVSAGTEGAEPVWSDQTAFENLILKPAFKEAGIDISDIK